MGWHCVVCVCVCVYVCRSLLLSSLLSKVVMSIKCGWPPKTIGCNGCLCNSVVSLATGLTSFPTHPSYHVFCGIIGCQTHQSIKYIPNKIDSFPSKQTMSVGFHHKPRTIQLFFLSFFLSFFVISCCHHCPRVPRGPCRWQWPPHRPWPPSRPYRCATSWRRSRRRHWQSWTLGRHQ